MSDKLISANNLIDYINNNINEMTKIGVIVDGEYLWELINDAIDNAPAIDTGDLVRCKDCKYFGRSDFGKGKEHWCKRFVRIYDNGLHEVLVLENDFCAWGIRREDEKT